MDHRSREEGTLSEEVAAKKKEGTGQRRNQNSALAVRKISARDATLGGGWKCGDNMQVILCNKKPTTPCLTEQMRVNLHGRPNTVSTQLPSNSLSSVSGQDSQHPGSPRTLAGEIICSLMKETVKMPRKVDTSLSSYLIFQFPFPDFYDLNSS